MAKYKVTIREITTYTKEVEAEYESLAIHEATFDSYSWREDREQPARFEFEVEEIEE